MKTDVISLDGKKAGDIDLPDAIFGIEARTDILHRVVNWQLAKRRAGTHAVEFRSDVSGSTARINRQKGSGRARHGTRKVNIFRGGGRAFGPIPRDHGFRLPKKIRALGLRSALSAKNADKKILVIDDLKLKDGKTATLVKMLEKIGLSSALFVAGAEVDEKFKMALSNIPRLDVLPTRGLNVYDILKRDTLVLSKDAVAAIGERLK